MGSGRGEGEEEEARRKDWRQFSDFVGFEGEGFGVRVEFLEYVRGRAVEAGRELFGVIGNLLDGRGRKELNGRELKFLIGEARLTGFGSERARTSWF